MLDLVKEGLKQEPVAKESIKAAEEGKTKVFQIEDGLSLYKMDKQLCVHYWFNLRRRLVGECHDINWEGHPGTKGTRAD